MKLKTLRQLPLFLGIETGATRSVAILADASGTCLQRV
jgi:N-acetylglucosamine kinase-like BadF-type ATPase